MVSDIHFDQQLFVQILIFFYLLFTFNRIFPWGCVSGFLKRLVPDAAPQHHITNGVPATPEEDDITTLASNNNTTAKAAPLLVHRVSVGERVL